MATTQDPMKRESLRRKRSSRLAAVQAHYRQLVSEKTLTNDALFAQIWQQWQDSIQIQDPEWPSEDMPEQALLKRLIEGVSTHESSLSTLIESVIKENWRQERMDPVMRAILYCAVYELEHAQARHSAMILDEYVTIASSFFDGMELGYIHSALQLIAGTLRPAPPDSDG